MNELGRESRRRRARVERETLLNQRGYAVWFTGLSGSGKSTIARALERRLDEEDRLVYVLDGDVVREGLCADLDFSPEGRSENIRRIGEVAALFVDAGLIVLAAFISPYRRDRQMVRSTVEADRFVEVFVDTPLEICEERDPKGLYARARAGEIEEFTGVSAPYEAPVKPDVTLRTEELSVDECVERVYREIERRGALRGPDR